MINNNIYNKTKKNYNKKNKILNGGSKQTSINEGYYIANNNGGWWRASTDQFKAIERFPLSNYGGMGAGYWRTNKSAIHNIKGINNTYEIVLTINNFYIKTSDGKYRVIKNIQKSAKPTNKYK
jgi:hypothetical protein